jgi:hypothetical protein
MLAPMRTGPLTGRLVPSLALAAVLTTAAIALVGVSSLAAGPTRGTIPPEAFRSGEAIDQSMVPDYIPALGRDGAIVGWVSKTLAVPADDSIDRSMIPVYADDLKTIVGQYGRWPRLCADRSRSRVCGAFPYRDSRGNGVASARENRLSCSWAAHINRRLPGSRQTRAPW